MNTRQLTYVLSIAETGNLSAAAKELGVSQPALSKYLAELEDELGTELFLRYKKQLYPTAAGKIYLEAATRIIGVKEQTYQIISELSNGYQKTLHIGVTPLRGSIAIAQIFNQFHRRYPNVKIEMKERYMAGLRRAIQDHSVELALGTCNDPDDPDIIHTSFHEEELVLFVPSFHPLAYQASQDLDHLTAIDIRKFQDTPFLLATENSTIRQTADMIFQQNQMQPTVVYESDNNLILKHMADQGAGVALLGRGHVEHSKNLVYFSLKPSYSVHMTIMSAPDHILSEEERFLIYLNYLQESKRANYRFNPNANAKRLLKEYELYDTERRTHTWTPKS